MQSTSLLLILLALSTAAYVFAKKRSIAVSARFGGVRELQSLPSYYGYLAAATCALPAIAVLCVWSVSETAVITDIVVGNIPNEHRASTAAGLSLQVNDIKNLVAGNIAGDQGSPVTLAAAEQFRELKDLSERALTVVALVAAIAGAVVGWRIVSPRLQARRYLETGIRYFLIACSTVAVFTTVGIVLSVLFEALRFFQEVSVSEFLFGLNWSPQTAIRSDQVGSSGAFGAVPLFVGTLLISGIAMIVAVPIGLMSAIYLSEYAGASLRAVGKPLLEVLAGIPTVVYGFFAALTVAPFLRDNGALIGLEVSSETALAAGLVMGIMIIPFVSSLSDDVINSVPQSLRDGSYALGATRSETIKQVVLPAALPGIVGGVLLAVSRAIGETMIVVMAAGLAANLTVNPLQAVTTVTVQIVTLLVGDQEFDSAKTLAAFALGLLLFVVTLVLNIVALHVVRKYREQYD